MRSAISEFRSLESITELKTSLNDLVNFVDPSGEKLTSRSTIRIALGAVVFGVGASTMIGSSGLAFCVGVAGLGVGVALVMDGLQEAGLMETWTHYMENRFKTEASRREDGRWK